MKVTVMMFQKPLLFKIILVFPLVLAILSIKPALQMNSISDVLIN
jgi:hypothetical protein